MRTEQQQRMLRSMRERIIRDRETGFIPTLRGMGFLKKFPSSVPIISQKKPTPEQKELNDRKRRAARSR